MEKISLFEIKDLTYFYPGRQSPALKQIDLSLEEGELLLVVGGSGSGKSSLARVLAGLIPDYYGGKICGQVFFQDQLLNELDRRSLSSKVGIVFQDPEKQLVMTSVEAEIAFGLENLGLSQREMFRRVAEVMSFLNLSSLKDEFTASLSGGQQQKVALASVLAMQPRVLILDEPTSQLDPVAADEFFYLVERLSQELGYTVVLIEQRLERCWHLADRLAVMGQGQILYLGPGAEGARWEATHGLPFIPPVAKFFASLDNVEIPATVKDGRRELIKYAASVTPGPETHDHHCNDCHDQKETKPAVLNVDDVWFAYDNGKMAIGGITLAIAQGDFLVILGENAAGKSTLLKLMAGILKPERGQVTVLGEDTRRCTLSRMAHQVAYLSQNPNDYLFEDTVEAELLFTLNNLGKQDRGIIDRILGKLSLTGMRGANPRDLSGGERQRVALAAVLVADPQILLLDEPTRGMDYSLKNDLGALLQDFNEDGLTTVLVTHDVEFAAEYGGRVAIMFDGRIIGNGSKQQVLRGSAFYSPQMARLFNGISDGVLTVGDAVKKARALGMVDKVKTVGVMKDRY